MTTPTQAQIAAGAMALHKTVCDNVYTHPCDFCTRLATAALTAAAEVRPADISCPFCGGENGQHDHNCGLKKTAVDPAMRDFIKDTPYSEPNDGWAAEAGNTQKVVEGYNYGWRAAFESTIERCAQVAEGFSQRTKSSAWEWAAQEIATAIRALKDKP